MRKVIYFILLFFYSGITVLYGQRECASQIGGNLRPIGESNFMRAYEASLGGGYLSQDRIINGMFLLGLDYTSGYHSFYFEGGLKFSSRQDNDLDTINQFNGILGFREAYYQYKKENNKLIVGVQSMKSGSDYLLNERVLGVNYGLKLNKWSLKIYGGTVTKDFARNGIFCGTSYIYNFIHDFERPVLGSTPGQTNLAGTNFEFHPSRRNNTQVEDDGLGFSFEESVEENHIQLETIGVALYSEFGSFVSGVPVLLGGYLHINFGNDWWLKPEIFYQNSNSNNAVIYNARLEKSINWENMHHTSFMFRYIGLFSIDEGAVAVNRFSNILGGTVLRMDSPDLPLYQAAIKHKIPKIKMHVKLQYTSQVKSNNMNEFNIGLGRKFNNKWLVNTTYAYVVGRSVEDISLYRVEAKYNF